VCPQKTLEVMLTSTELNPHATFEVEVEGGIHVHIENSIECSQTESKTLSYIEVVI